MSPALKSTAAGTAHVASAAAGGAPPAAVRSFETLFEAREPDVWSAPRKRALERFVQLGLPTMRDESWRYTNLRPIANQSFAAAAADLGAAIEPEAGLVPTPATLVLVNGHPMRARAMDGVEISTLRELSRRDPGLIARHLEPLSDAEESRWRLLNTALFEDGLHIRITGNVPEPVVILHVATALRPGTAAFPKVIVEAAPGASATLIEHHVQAGAEVPLTNGATLLDLGADARIEHYRVFAAGPSAVHLDSLEVRQRKDSTLRQFTVTLSGGLVRAALDAKLCDTGARLDSFSLLVGRDRRHVDCVNVVEHAARHTTSAQTARAIASGTSRVIFNSKVVVDAGAAQAESRQSSRGLLLSPSAEIDSRPQLEIHTDEVKCAHGATIGRLDPNMLFYLLSRGLDRATAQSLLVYAFLGDVLTGMSVGSARAAIESALIAELPGSQTLRNFR
jgi:Fe-S cluster assembly protein SufD